MSETNKAAGAKRRLDLGSAPAARGERTTVKNPYLKAPKPTASSEGDVASSTITPEAGIEKFFVSKKPGDAKPRAARQLVTPRDETSEKRAKPSGVSSEDDDVEGRYYHSDGEKKKKKLYDPGHIHSTLDYGQRGDVPLGQGTKRAYRFVREHFLIPRDIETNPTFGAHSGSCFEERVIRAYSLGQLEPKGGQNKGSLLVCSYCGDEGHKREDCADLL